MNKDEYIKKLEGIIREYEKMHSHDSELTKGLEEALVRIKELGGWEVKRWVEEVNLEQSF